MTNSQRAEEATKILMHLGVSLDAERVRRLADNLELLKACREVVDWYENSGNDDPTDATIPWRICRDAIKNL